MVRQRNGIIMAYEHYKLQPDIIAIGKSIGNGYPVSVVVIKADVACKLENGKNGRKT